MKILSFATIAAAFIALPAAAATPVAIPGLLNSGIDASGSGVSTGTIADAHWTLDGGPAWNSSSIHTAWLANNSDSRWLTPTADGTESLDPQVEGFYTYSLSFDLTGFLPGTASFDGRFAVDNEVTAITLNGVQIDQAGIGNYNAWTGFSADSGFVAGVNTLNFTVRNLPYLIGNPSGLRVEFLGSAVTGVPEPATWAMLIAGFGLVGAASRRRRLATVTA